jgi:hypothetical protein
MGTSTTCQQCPLFLLDPMGGRSRQVVIVLFYSIKGQIQVISRYKCTLAVPKFIQPNYGDFLKKTSSIKCKSKDLYLEQYWGRLLPAGLG